jgi:hypothetical protein
MQSPGPVDAVARLPQLDDIAVRVDGVAEEYAAMLRGDENGTLSRRRRLALAAVRVVDHYVSSAPEK